MISPEAGAILFLPSFKDAMPIWMDDRHSHLGEHNLAARLARGPKPMRVWGKEGITYPCIAAGGRDGTEARVALATDLSGRLFATRTPMEGALGLRLAMGAVGKK